MQAIGGSITRNIAAELRIGTGQRPTALGERPAVILLPNAKAVPVNSWADRVEIWPAIGPREPAWAIGVPAEILATGRVEAEGIA